MDTAKSKIDASELKEMRDEGQDMVLLNVLSAEKFAEEHIPGSENIHTDTPNFVHEVERLAGSKGRHIVVYCGGGKESSIAAFGLENAGFTNVEHFRGGMAEWKQLGYEIERGAHVDLRP